MNTNKIRFLLKDITTLFQLSNSASAKSWVILLNDIEKKLKVNSSISEGLQKLKPYLGGMGSLEDVYFSDDNNNVPKGFTSELANKELKHKLAMLLKEFNSFNISK